MSEEEKFKALFDEMPNTVKDTVLGLENPDEIKDPHRRKLVATSNLDQYQSVADYCNDPENGTPNHGRVDFLALADWAGSGSPPRLAKIKAATTNSDPAVAIAASFAAAFVSGGVVDSLNPYDSRVTKQVDVLLAAGVLSQDDVDDLLDLVPETKQSLASEAGLRRIKAGLVQRTVAMIEGN